MVPTRELGVQLVMLVFRLFGGNVSTGVPGAPGSIFEYSGPRGLKASQGRAGQGRAGEHPSAQIRQGI